MVNNGDYSLVLLFCCRPFTHIKYISLLALQTLRLAYGILCEYLEYVYTAWMFQVTQVANCFSYTKQTRAMPRMNDPFWKETRKILFRNIARTILFGTKHEWSFLKRDQERTFSEMEKSSSNVPNVFEGSPLTGHRGYWESQRTFITFFNISSLTAHIQRFPI